MAQPTAARRAERTPFSTDPADELPVGVQLTWRLRALINTGRLGAGERLPSFRRLAEWAGVNVNTVRAVYAGLEKEGLVVSRQGQGTFVADGIQPAPELEQIAMDALQRASDAGLSPRELAIVATACATMPPSPKEAPSSKEAPAKAPVPKDARAGRSAAAPEPATLPSDAESEAIEVRHELRRQIGRLEAELAAYVRHVPDDLPTARRSAEAHIAGVEELEQTRDTLIAQLSEAQRAAERRAREQDEAQAQRRMRLDEGEGPEQAEPGTGSLSRAMSWWRGKA